MRNYKLIWKGLIVSQARLYILPRGEVKSENLPIPFWFTKFEIIAHHVNGMLICFMSGHFDRFSWMSPECWWHQSNWKAFNNDIYLLYWSQDPYRFK